MRTSTPGRSCGGNRPAYAPNWSFPKVFELCVGFRYTLLRQEEWSMPEKRREVRLTAAERDVLEKFVAQGTKSARAITRARILLLLDEARPAKELTKILGVSRGTLYNVRKKYMQKEQEHILDVLS